MVAKMDPIMKMTLHYKIYKQESDLHIYGLLQTLMIYYCYQPQTEVNQVLDILLWTEIQVDQFPLLLV